MERPVSAYENIGEGRAGRVRAGGEGEAGEGRRIDAPESDAVSVTQLLQLGHDTVCYTRYT